MTRNHTQKLIKQAAQVHPALNAASIYRREKESKMTKTIRDIRTHEGMTIADRLKVARQDASLTRKALADATGIPPSSIEKYESGNMDPNTQRLQVLCDFFDVSVYWMLKGDDAPNVSETGKTAETQTSANVSETSTETSSVDAPEGADTASTANENDPAEHIQGMLAELDDMRADGFENIQRGASALIEDILAALKRIEPEELLFIANERELHRCESDTVENILDMFRESAIAAQSYCGNIGERIIDTAIFGVDLYTLNSKPLADIAQELSEEHNFKSPKLFGWGEHSDFIHLIRSHLWALAIYSEGYDFEDLEAFPKRENPDDTDASKSRLAKILDDII